MRGKRILILTGLAVLSVTVGGLVTGVQAAPAEVKPWDFNADGHPELVVEAPNATVDNLEGAGAIGLFPGEAEGPSKVGRSLDESADDVPGEPQALDYFGGHTTSGDFNGDGHADLAACFDDIDGDATGMILRFGSPDGLASTTALEESDCGPMEAADANADGYDDLFVGGDAVQWAPGGEDADSPGAWKFEVIDKDDYGLGFGNLAVGDLNGDDTTDIAYLTADEEIEELRVRLGGSDGFTPGGTTQWAYWMAPAIGDVNGDGYDDLAVGDTGNARVGVWQGSADGVDFGQAPATITQDTDGVPGSTEDGAESFGAAVAMADANGDGYDDLAIGVPGESIGTVQNAGRVVGIPGSEHGPDPMQAFGVHQGKEGVPGGPETGDHFGERVLYRDLTEDASAELVVTSGWEDDEAGRVDVIDQESARVFKPGHAGIDPTRAHFGSLDIEVGS